MEYRFDYKEFSKIEKNISLVEEKIITDQFKTMVDGNDSFADKSSPEMEHLFWVFRHGWICRSMIV